MWSQIKKSVDNGPKFLKKHCRLSSAILYYMLRYESSFFGEYWQKIDKSKIDLTESKEIIKNSLLRKKISKSNTDIVKIPKDIAIGIGFIDSNMLIKVGKEFYQPMVHLPTRKWMYNETSIVHMRAYYDTSELQLNVNRVLYKFRIPPKLRVNQLDLKDINDTKNKIKPFFDAIESKIPLKLRTRGFIRVSKKNEKIIHKIDKLVYDEIVLVF